MFALKLNLRMHLAGLGFQRLLGRRNLYDWGKYEANTGTCCRMRDKETTACAMARAGGPVSEVGNPCDRKSDINKSFKTEYAKHLREIYSRGKNDQKCNLISHDAMYNVSSSKTRRFQRTWAECPMIYLRNKPTCCPDPEFYPMGKRRPRTSQSGQLSAIEMHHFQMSLLCKPYLQLPGCQRARQPPRCKVLPKPRQCQKPVAPLPSFSEACRHLLPNYCVTDCSCKLPLFKCDLWREKQIRRRAYESCIRMPGFSPLKQSRFPY